MQALIALAHPDTIPADQMHVFTLSLSLSPPRNGVDIMKLGDLEAAGVMGQHGARIDIYI